MDGGGVVLSEAGQAAVALARDHGFYVFPAEIIGKTKKSKKSAKFSGGVRWGATNDPAQVERDFVQFPDALIGIAAGESGIFALDLDTKNSDPETGCDGVEWFAKEIDKNGGYPQWPDTVEAMSPSGSWHIYFKIPAAFTPKNSEGVIAAGVDVRGEGGMLIAPPSLKPGADRPYVWRKPPDEVPVAEAPGWVLDLVRKTDEKNPKAGGFRADAGAAWNGVADYRDWVLSAQTDGEKHKATLKIAGSLAAQGVSESFTTGLIQAVCPVWDDNLRKSITSAYEKFRGNSFRHNDINLIRDSKGFPIWNVANAEALLTRHSDWQGVLAYNAFTGRRMVQAPLPGSSDGNRIVEDEDYTAVQAWFNRNGFPKATATITIPALRSACRARTYNPLTAYLESLEWDGTNRIGTWLVDYAGAADSKYVREAGARWMISAVARAFEPGVKVDHMLVLESEQGRLKSSGIRALAGGEDYYGDNLPDMGSKDAQEYVRGKWIIEVAELVAARRDIQTVKAFLTRQVDEFRWSHGVDPLPRPRQCVFIGTTNDDKYLRDETGNRRFWPVRVDRLDVEQIKADRDQLWAEAVQLYRRGVKWWLSPEVEDMARNEQAQRLDVDAWHSDVAAFVEGKDEVAPRQVLGAALSMLPERIERKHSDRVVGILKTLGFEKNGQMSSGEFKGSPRYVRVASR